MVLFINLDVGGFGPDMRQPNVKLLISEKDLMTNAGPENQTKSSLNVALVAMPWAYHTMPSPAIGMLGAVVREKAPEYHLDCKYPFLDLCKRIGPGLYSPLTQFDKLGEFFYAVQLYPEMTPSLREHFTQYAKSLGLEGKDQSKKVYDKLHEKIGEHIDDLVEELAGKYDVIGFTTSYSQLFASIVVGKKLKAVDSKVKVVLGGMGVPYEIGSSVLAEYPFIDYVVQGEGEYRFLNLLRAIEAGATVNEEGILKQEPKAEESGPASNKIPFFKILKNEVSDLNELPMPDYSEFAALAKAENYNWSITLEGSRGCWWDRVVKTKNPMNSCFFCALNTSSYRQKTVEKMAHEIDTLSARFGNTRLQFLDNIIRKKGIEDLTEAMADHGRDYTYFYEMRGNVHPYEFLVLWESGCNVVQIGIEGLSTAYLKRINKGTSAIQNLQCMKICFELGIRSNSNLIIDWPGSTKEEVEETVQIINDYAISFQPCTISPFTLYAGSAMSRMPQKFGISKVSNCKEFKHALPKDVLERLTLYWLDYETGREEVSWEPVKEATDAWRKLHVDAMKLGAERDALHRKRLFTYRDGKTFLGLFDKRGTPMQYRMNQLLRDIYIYCMEIRSYRQILKKFSGRASETKIKTILRTFVEKRFTFTERDKYLSLAVANHPRYAVRRIREAREEELREKQGETKLMVV